MYSKFHCLMFFLWIKKEHLSYLEEHVILFSWAYFPASESSQALPSLVSEKAPPYSVFLPDHILYITEEEQIKFAFIPSISPGHIKFPLEGG